MKRLLIATYIIGTLTILQPGGPASYGYQEKNGDFRVTTPGRGTTYGYNQGNGVTTVLPPDGPASYIYQERGRHEAVPPRLAPIIEPYPEVE